MDNIKNGTIIFATAAYNLAETGRMLEIAGAAQRCFDILFLTYGGQFEELIEARGFKLARLEPRLTTRKLARLKVILSGETFNTVGYFNYRELVPRVAAELSLFRDVKPLAVVTGWSLSVTLSARIAGIPFVNVLHSTSITEYYQAGLQTWPDRLDRPFFRKLASPEILNRRINRRILESDFPVKPYNRLGKKYGLPPFRNFMELIEGDYVLLADIPCWVDLPALRPKIHYIGPLVLKLDLPVPDEILKLQKDRPVVYFAMGSSGKPILVKALLEGFRGQPYSVIAPVRNLVNRLNIDVPENVIVTEYLPAHIVNPLADIAVIHGGQNTVMNACLSGTPIVGIGMHPEQEANLEACVRKGFAVRLNKWTMRPAQLYEAIAALLRDRTAKTSVEAFRKELAAWDGPSRAADFFLKTFAAG